jgi:uncharacterized protein DUF6755
MRAAAWGAVFAIVLGLLILVVLQRWLLTATMNAYPGGDGVVWPALGASAACLALNLGLLNDLRRR